MRVMADGKDEERTKALVPVAAPQPPLRLAASLEAARAGELLAVDRRGRVLSRAQQRRVVAGSWSLMGTVVAGTGLLYGSAFSPLAGMIAAAASAGYFAFRMRNWPRYRAAMALVGESRWEDAHAALLALDGAGLPRLCHRSARATLGALDQLLGRPEAALERVNGVLAELGDSLSVIRWQAATVRAAALVRLGRLDEAGRERDRFVTPRPDYVELLYQGVVLAIAFAADAPESLPATDALHEWARAGLQRSKFGETLVSLAWAFHRRGDDDMARHLLLESASRIPRAALPMTQPGLHAWAEQRRAAWGLDAGEAQGSEPLD